MDESLILSWEQSASELLKEIEPKILGSRMKRERIAQGLSIRELAKSSNLGINSIVRMESGKGFRALTILKACAALGIHIERVAHSIGSDSIAVHRRADDKWHELDSFGESFLKGCDSNLNLAERKKAVAGTTHNPLLTLKSRLELGKILPTIIEVHHDTEARSHPGEEFVYVIRGSVRITVSGQDYVLVSGESIDFWGSEPHSYGPTGKAPALILSLRINP